jgi:3,4-dihydroxy-9,10-secoandrosta-1,3,5(10)-triene-9,17-dione 4,5-dioxygenase
VFSVTEVGKWHRFATHALGMQAVADDGMLYLRADERPFRIPVCAGEKDALIATGWEAPTADSHRALVKQIAQSGAAVTTANAGHRGTLGGKWVCEICD